MQRCQSVVGTVYRLRAVESFQKDAQSWNDTELLDVLGLRRVCVAHFLNFGNNLLVSGLMLLVGQQEGHPACEKYGGWWRWALISPDGVAPSRMVGLSASVIFPCSIKSRNSLLAMAHLGGPGKRAVYRLWCGGQWFEILVHQNCSRIHCLLACLCNPVV